jgi:hypothetical protein
MFLLPNIQHLDLGTSSRTYGSYVHDIWRQLLGLQSKEIVEHDGMNGLINVDSLSQTGRPLILSHLEFFSTRVDNSTYENAPNIDVVEDILAIPSLKNFYCWGLQQDWSENLRLPLAHLQQVFLDDCRISQDALVCLIKSCKKLECLDVVWSEWSDWTEVALGAPLLIALNERKDTLKRLTLLLPCMAKQLNPGLHIYAPFDLRRLENLEVLSIDYEIMFSERETAPGEDCENSPKFPHNLPKSIEKLNIQYCLLDEDMAECASYLLGVKHKYNKLKSLQVTYESFESDTDAMKEQLLSLSCVAGIYKAFGVEMRVVSEDGQFIGPHPVFKGRHVGQRSQGERLDVSDSKLGDLKKFTSGDDYIDVCDDVDDDDNVDDDDDNEIDASATED